MNKNNILQSNKLTFKLCDQTGRVQILDSSGNRFFVDNDESEKLLSQLIEDKPAKNNLIDRSSRKFWKKN